MNFLEQLLINQENNKANSTPKLSPLQTPEQFAQNQQVQQQRQGLTEKLQQPGSLTRGLENFLIHPRDAIFGAKSPQQEVPVSYQQPLVGVDMTQNDYNNAQSQGLLPESPMISTGVKENPRIGGLLSDIAGGAKENAQTPFDMSNIENNQTSDGRNKGLAYRLGEGLGTAGKFMASPAGRAVGTGLLVAATGGNPTQAITYGLQAGVGNYQNVQEDKMNRNLLQSQVINTENIRGYLNNDMAKSYTDNYKNLNDSRYKFASLELRDKLATMQDNTTKAKSIMDAFKSNMIDETQAVNLANMYGLSVNDLQESNQTKNTKINEYLAPAKKRAYELAPQIAMGNLGVAQNNSAINGGRLNLQQQEFDYKKNNPNAGKTEEQLANLQNLNQDLQDFQTMFDTVPNAKAGMGYQAEVAKNKLRRNVMSLSPHEQSFETSRNNLKFRIITALDDAGKRVTNVEMNQIDKALPSLDMTYAQKQAAYKELNRLITNKYGIKMGAIQSIPSSQPQQNNKTFKSGKYTVTVH